MKYEKIKPENIEIDAKTHSLSDHSRKTIVEPENLKENKSIFREFMKLFILVMKHK